MRLTRFASPLTFALVLTATACHHDTTAAGKTPKGDGPRAAAIELPDPLPLPADPPAAAWLAEPSRALAMLAPYSPSPIDGHALAQSALAQLTTPELASSLAESIDLRGPLGYVAIDREQEVIRVTLLADAREALASTLAQQQAVGEFGAVRLPNPHTADGQAARADGREWLVWIDDADSSLVIANSLPGLVTGRAIGSSYGRDPVFFTTDLSLAPMPIEVPISRISGHGDLGKLLIDAQVIDGQDPLAGLPISAGSLGGLLTAKDIAVGVSGRYADYQGVVRDITTEVNANVRELPFLVKGIGEDLAAKLNTLLRTWDGRVLVALGPANHVRIAYGAGDTKKSGVATIRLLQTVVDNVSLARNFVSQLPRLSLRRRVAKADGIDIELFVVQDVQANLPPELRSLLDREGRLNIAMAWSERGGGGMIVVGPDAVAQLSSWLDQSRDAPPHDSTAEQLLAAAFAAAPEVLQALLATREPNPAQLLALSASGPRWDVAVVGGQDGRYQVEVQMPGPPPIPRAKTQRDR